MTISEGYNIIQGMLDAIDAMTTQEQQLLIQQMRTDTALFCEICFPHVMCSLLTDKQRKEYVKFALPRNDYMPTIHEDMYKSHDGLFNDELDNISTVVFRRGSKTTVKNLCNVKVICYNIYQCVGFISETKDQAAQDIDTIKDELEHNPILHKFFGKMIMVKDNAYTKVFQHPIYKNEIIYIATGLNGRIRGMNYRKQRPQLVCVDDFESESNSLTPGGREKVQRIIHSKIFHLGDHKYKKAFYGTIVHHETFLAATRSMETFNGIRGRYLECPVSNSPSIQFDPYKNRMIVISTKNFQIGTLNWPQAHSRQKLQESLDYFKRYKGGNEFWQFLQEMYNIPKTDSEPVFDPDAVFKLKATYKRYADIAYLETDDGKKIPIYVYDGFDPAAGRELKNDRTVKMTVGITPAKKIIILDIVADRLGYDDQRELCVASHKKYKPKKMCIESFGTQLSLYDSIVDLFRRKGLSQTFKKYNRTSISKSNKFKQYLIPLVNGGIVGYLEGCPNVDILLREMAAYSYEVEHDDTLDGLFLCVYAAGTSHPEDANVDNIIRGLARQASVFGQMRQPSTQKNFSQNYLLF